MKMLRLIARGLLPACFILLPMHVRAQSEAAPASSPALNDQEERGRGLFYQRCALCHLPKIQKPRVVPPVGPVLTGLFKPPKPRPEAPIRQLILKGSPNMPAFQYGLEPKELDDIIAYMKTL